MKTIFASLLMLSSLSAFAAPTEQEIAMKLNHQDQVEIEASRLAGGRAASADVLSYATRVERNHLEANLVLQTLAQATGTEIKPMEMYREELDALVNLSGAAFDRAYAELMVNVHRYALNFIAEADGSKAIGAFARVTQARVQNGLDGAQKLPK